MGENVKKWILPVVIGLVVIYLLYRYAGSRSPSRTSYVLQSAGGGADSGATAAREQSRMAGFQALAGIASEEIRARAQSEQVGASLEVEKLKTGLQRELGLQQLEGYLRNLAGQQEAYRIASADRRYDTDAQLAAIDRTALAQTNLFTAQADAAWRTLQMQIAAVSSIGQQYRGQSLERQGTILNALTSIWGQQPYSYVNAFGGTRPPTFLQQLGGFLQQSGLGGLFGGFF